MPANRRDSASCVSASTFTAKLVACAITGAIVASLPMHTITSGGSRLSDEKALTVMPCGVPFASCVVMTVMPDAKRPRTARNKS